MAGIAVFLAVICTWLCLFPLFNRLWFYFKRDQYRVESFEVTGAVRLPMRKGFRPYWLTGTVQGHAEHLLPQLPATFKPASPEDLLSLYPTGSTVSVLYEPHAPEALIQGEKLRVLHFTPDFWEKEARRRNKFLCLVLLPVPLTLAFYRYVRKRDYIFPRFRREKRP